MVLSFSFHQKPRQNTIRILVEKPLEPNHPRIAPLIQESGYRFEAKGEDFDLIPPGDQNPVLQFQVVRDENTRALIFLKQDADVLYDNLSIAKTEWVRTKMTNGSVRILSSSGDAVSQLALNEDSPKLKDPQVRMRIAKALPIRLWSEKVFLNWVEPFTTDMDSDPESPDSPGPLTLTYLATPTREGQQLAYLTREALAKIGIRVQIRIYEPALFYAKIRSRDFDLFSSTSVEGMKTILDLPHTDRIPLFRWKHGLILNSRIRTPQGVEREFDYSFRFLRSLQLQ
jgi:ABC-type transport system substrate-binding protein